VFPGGCWAPEVPTEPTAKTVAATQRDTVRLPRIGMFVPIRWWFNRISPADPGVQWILGRSGSPVVISAHPSRRHLGL